MKEKETAELIRTGLKYIGFPFGEEEDISFETLISIRKYIFNKSNEWYQLKFVDAFNFDIGITRKTADGYYSSDGIYYYFNENMELTSCILYDDVEKDKKKKTIETKPIKWSFHCKKNGDYFFYNYINEIDHFFTFCINYYLLVKKGYGRKEIRFGQEKGLVYIKNAIEEYRRTQCVAPTS